MITEFQDYNSVKWVLKGNTIIWRCSHGTSDAMMALNCAYHVAHVTRKSLVLNMHWKNGSDYRFHCEDSENVTDHIEYLHKFYHGYGRGTVEVVNEFNKPYGKQLHYNIDSPTKGYVSLKNITSWSFDRKFLDKKPYDKMVVYWRPFSSIGKMPDFKKQYDDDYWENIIQILKSSGYTLIEVSYRTPIREVLYLIQRCQFVIGYHGLYQYISRNLFKPSIILGSNGNLGQSHNPHARLFKNPKSEKNLLVYLENFNTHLPSVISKCNQYRQQIERVMYNDP